MVLSGCDVKVLFRQHGSLLDHETDAKQGWEGVGEVADTDGTNEGTEVSKKRDGTSDDKGKSPVDRNKNYPDEFASLFGKGWEICYGYLANDDLCHE